MALETTMTSLTELINSELIDPMIADYAIDYMVAIPACRERNLAGAATRVAAFPKWVKDSAAALATEFDSSSNNELETTEVTVTAAKVGITREPSEELLATTILGAAGLVEFVVEDGGRLIGEKMDTDALALFTSATSHASHGGTAYSIAYFIEEMAKMRVLKAAAPWTKFAGAKQSEDLQASIAATTGTVFGNSAQNAQGILRTSENGFMGHVFGIPVMYSNLVPTSDAAANEVGAMLTDARGNERQAALALAILWAPRLMHVEQPRTVSHLYTIHAAYGVGLINASSIVKSTSRAS